jgi:hypothetical protein
MRQTNEKANCLVLQGHGGTTRRDQDHAPVRFDMILHESPSESVMVLQRFGWWVAVEVIGFRFRGRDLWPWSFGRVGISSRFVGHDGI